MKTPTKQKSGLDGGGGNSPGPKVFHKRYELLVVFCGPTREDVVGAPDVGILPCAVPGSSLETTRIGQHVTEGKILELIQVRIVKGCVCGVC